jgi:hypothetical protein
VKRFRKQVLGGRIILKLNFQNLNAHAPVWIGVVWFRIINGGLCEYEIRAGNSCLSEELEFASLSESVSQSISLTAEFGLKFVL